MVRVKRQVLVGVCGFLNTEVVRIHRLLLADTFKMLASFCLLFHSELNAPFNAVQVAQKLLYQVMSVLTYFISCPTIWNALQSEKWQGRRKQPNFLLHAMSSRQGPTKT